MSEAYFIFGRFNPPTIAHQRILEEYKDKNLFIYLSHSEGDDRNPISYLERIELLKEMGFSPRISDAKNPFEALTEVYKQGIEKITILVGLDRFQTLYERLSSYNGTRWGNDEGYTFKPITYQLTGDRKDGISSTAARLELQEKGTSEMIPEKIRGRVIAEFKKYQLNSKSKVNGKTRKKKERCNAC